MHGTIDNIGDVWDKLPDEVAMIADRDLETDWVWDGQILHLPLWLMREMDASETLAACGIGIDTAAMWETN